MGSNTRRENPVVDRLTDAGRVTYARLSALSDTDLRATLIDDSATAIGALAVDLLDRLTGYQQTIARLTERPASNSTETSDAAASNVAKNLSALRLRVLAEIAAEQLVGHQPTSDAVEAKLGMSHQTVSARFNDLRKMGLIDHTGTKARTRTGNQAMVHQITTEGWRQLRNSRSRLNDLGHLRVLSHLDTQPPHPERKQP